MTQPTPKRGILTLHDLDAQAEANLLRLIDIDAEKAEHVLTVITEGFLLASEADMVAPWTARLIARVPR